MVYRASPYDIANRSPQERIIERYYPTATDTTTNGNTVVQQPQIQNLGLILVIIAIVAGVALGLAISNSHKKEKD